MYQQKTTYYTCKQIKQKKTTAKKRQQKNTAIFKYNYFCPVFQKHLSPVIVIRTVIIMSAMFCFTSVLYAQTADPLFNRLCKSWRIVKIEDNGQAQQSDATQADYRMVFNIDSTMLQGLAPDGFIQSRWKLDEKNMIINISDSQTKSLYHLRIIKITNEELILQNLDESRSLIIYYKSS